MTRTVFKFPLEHGINTITLPSDFNIISGGKDAQGQPCIWVDLDNLAPAAIRLPVQFFGTGQAIPDGWIFLATFLDAPFVWHIFIGEPESC